ncbi:MAG: hypothetical protein LAO20_00325 [Acidobacteriia bacterium]|nr:hypothetical protein [Terriglobia bacterium]
MKTDCSCSTAVACESTIAERPRYFPRQIITPDDLTLAQDYFRDRMRRHNRLLHGWGVVCGALVCPLPATDGSNGFEPWQVIVKPGYALGPYGDEIVIDCERTVDLRTQGITGMTGDPCVQPADPWCSEVFLPPTQAGTLYIALKYKETMTRPVRVQPLGCGCNDNQCEYSRWRDCYEIGVLPDCPTPTDNPPTTEDLFKGPIPSCLPCPASPWVGLARVDFDQDGTITKIDNCDCRRLVISFSSFWWHCSNEKFDIQKVDPQTLTAGTKGAVLNITGHNFLCGIKALGDSNLVVNKTELVDAQTLKVTADVALLQVPGSAAIKAVNMDGTSTAPLTLKIDVAKVSPAPVAKTPVAKKTLPDAVKTAADEKHGSAARKKTSKEGSGSSGDRG